MFIFGRTSNNEVGPLASQQARAKLVNQDLKNVYSLKATPLRSHRSSIAPSRVDYKFVQKLNVVKKAPSMVQRSFKALQGTPAASP